MTTTFQTSYQQLLQSIDEIQASGKKVTVKVLPSATRRKRKSMIWLHLHLDLMMSLNSSTVPNTFLFFIMSKSIMISLLRKGNTGNEILEILEAIVSEDMSQVNEPTLEELEFWYTHKGGTVLDTFLPL